MNRPSPDATTDPRRRKAGLFAVTAIGCLLVIAFWWTGARMYLRWSQENSYYSHGFLIPIVSAFLLYLKRKDLAACPRRPSAWGMLLVVPSFLVHLAATAWQVGFLSGFVLLGVLAGLTLTLFGWKMLRLVIFPIGFLLFMVPLPGVLIEKISFNMKLMAAQAATNLVEVFGIVALREGSIIHIETGTLVVDDVCSGLKYLISLMAFAALYAHISAAKWWGKALLFALSVPIAFIANVARVALMVVAGYAINVEATQAWYFHDFFGFLLFIFAFVILFIVESILIGELRFGRRKEKAASAEAAAEESGDESADRKAEVVRLSSRLQGTVLSVLVVAAVLSVYFAWPRGTAAATGTLQAIPLTLGDWQGTDYRMDSRVYEILGTEEVISRSYRHADGERTSMVIVMAQQARRRSHPPEQCLRGEGYHIAGWSDRTVVVPLGTGSREIPVRELILERSGRTRISWYFFKSGDRVTTSYWGHQAGVALRKLTNPNATDILVRVDTTVPGDDREQSRATLTRFLGTVAAPIFEKLP